ncbi:MAG: AAA family ATPase [Gemmatimonadetes bacterium]|nr:AAA family ATPase [Gemmatimonadota bacterium]MYD27995.1 AAA family ATPase [Dehalococcoidia bacterium]MYI65283.1 AAA family ATPase [Gemmatimonadota bacterium]
MTTPSLDDLFDEVIELPDGRLQRAYDALVGLDHIKSRLVAESRIVLNPSALAEWSETAYGRRVALVDVYSDRPPLFVFVGDVGCGKTVLAQSFGDEIARSESVSVNVYRLSLNARGSGAVGEMTKLIGAAFATVREAAERVSSTKGRVRGAVVLIIDEADALAQSREMAQMHHEDRAGVNALIRGIDELVGRRLPIAVVFCTNRPDAIDPAVRRRAAEVFRFERPTAEQRRAVLIAHLGDLGFEDSELDQIADATGRNEQRHYGATYSDLVQRLLPSVLLDAMPHGRVEFSRVLALATAFEPTRPFDEQSQAAVPSGSPTGS